MLAVLMSTLGMTLLAAFAFQVKMKIFKRRHYLFLILDPSGLAVHMVKHFPELVHSFDKYSLLCAFEFGHFCLCRHYYQI